MSDAFGTPTPPAPAAAPAAPATSPADAGAGAAEAPAIHPAWERAVAHIPEAYRGPVFEGFREADREAQKAIEAARQAAAPEEWRNLLAEAQQAGLKPDDLVEAYNGRADMIAEMYADPDKFLGDLQAHIDREVEAGRITRKAGAAASAAAQQTVDAVQAAGGEDPLFDDPVAKRVAQLEKEIADQKQAATDAQNAERERLLQEQEQQRIDQEAEVFANTFISTFDEQMIAAGFRQAGADGGQSVDVLPAEMQRQIAAVAQNLLEANPTATPAQAITAATQQFQQAMQAMGATLPAPAAAGNPIPPVLGAGMGGASAAVPPPAPQATPKTIAEREARSQEAVRRMQELAASGR